MRYDFSVTGAAKTGKLIDDLLRLRSDRLRRDKVVDEIKEDEAQLAKVIEQRLNHAGVVSMRGKRGSFTLSEVVVPHVVNWDKFYQFMRDQNALDLLQKRVAVGAFREYIDEVDADGMPLRIPGVRADKIIKPTLTEVK